MAPAIRPERADGGNSPTRNAILRAHWAPALRPWRAASPRAHEYPAQHATRGDLALVRRHLELAGMDRRRLSMAGVPGRSAAPACTPQWIVERSALHLCLGHVVRHPLSDVCFDRVARES